MTSRPSPLLMSIAHAEPVFDRAEFPAAVERATAACYYLAADWGVKPEGRVRVRISHRGNLDGHGTPDLDPMMLGATLLCRGPELVDTLAPAVVDLDLPEGVDADDLLPLVSTDEPTA